MNIGEMHPTLFAYDTKGKVRQWSVEAAGGTVIVTHGLMGGKMQRKVTKCKAKNVGKANATTPDTQAILEAKAKWIKQIEREDYAEDVDDSGKQMRPMLALDYTKVPHRVNWADVVCQPKLDGLRLLAGDRYAGMSNHEMMTRKGEVYNVPHLMSQTNDFLRMLRIENEVISIDGEAYIPGMPLQQITSLARKYRRGKTEELEYHVFDLVLPGVGFMQRYQILEEVYAKYMNEFPEANICLVPVDLAGNEAEMKALHGKYVLDNNEGCMIRHASGLYRIGGRSHNLFKYKEFMDEEALITDMWEDKNGNAMLVVRQKNGKTCEVTPKRTHPFRKQMLLEPEAWIGKWINVKFQAFTDDGIFQFPVGRDLRECNDKGEPIL